MILHKHHQREVHRTYKEEKSAILLVEFDVIYYFRPVSFSLATLVNTAHRMYTLPKGPSRIVVSARRGPPRQLEFEGYYREKSIKLSTNGEGFGDQTAEMSNPKPTFQTRKPFNKVRTPSQNSPLILDNHLQMANLLSAQWKKVEDSLAKGKVEDTYETYKEKGPNKCLTGFQPFDLDKFLSRQTPRNLFGKPPS